MALNIMIWLTVLFTVFSPFNIIRDVYYDPED